MARQPLHCPATSTLPGSNYIARQPIHCQVATTLPGSHYIARQPLHNQAATTLPGSSYIARQPLHCQAATTLPGSHYKLVYPGIKMTNAKISYLVCLGLNKHEMYGKLCYKISYKWLISCLLSSLYILYRLDWILSYTCVG